jgi:carboxylesterase type B
MIRTSGFVVFAFMISGSLTASAAIRDPVSTDAGLISGTAGSSDNVRVYKGIPFAAPPLGLLHWSAPQPVSHWEGVRKADRFGPMCMQSRPGAGPSAVRSSMSEAGVFGRVLFQNPATEIEV